MTVASFFSVADAQMAVLNPLDGNGRNVSADTAVSVQVGNPSSCSSNWYAGLFKFDLSSIAAISDLYLISVVLSLWVTASTMASEWVRLHKVLGTWSEGSSDGPSYSLDDITQNLLSPWATGQYRDISDPALSRWVAEWIMYPTSNFGFLMAVVNAGASGQYLTVSTKEQTGTTQDPYLTISYTRKPSVTVTGVPSPSASIPATGNVTVSFSYSDPEGDTLTQVAIRRKRLTGA